MKKRTQILIVIGIILAILTLVWLISLAKCEILTKLYYDDFSKAYTQNTMIGEIEWFKVLSCDGKTAEVYYVSEGMTLGSVLTFEKIGGSWVETAWDTIWSASGSATGVVYPYWWHFIYGGF